MAKNNNLNDFLTDIANAIKTKKGIEDPINAQDFATEISTISGVPNVPTVECWKIDLSSLSDEEPDYIKSNCFLALDVFTGGNGEYGNYGKSILLSEIDGNIYGGIGPLYVIGSGHQEVTANIFYIAFMNVGFQGDFYSQFQEHLIWFRESCLDVAGEQISLSDFLSIAAQAQNYGYANEI